MDGDVIYHRSYWDFTKYARPARRQSDPFFTEEIPRQPVRGSIQALQMLPKALRPVDIYPKPGQDFEKAATDWEKRCSVLSSGKTGVRFSPVVGGTDDYGMGYPVIGHYVSVAGWYLAVPKEAVPDRNIWDLRPLLKKGIPVYASNVPYPNESGAWAGLNTPGWLTFTVLTDIEGAVLMQLGTQEKDSVESEDPFMDFIVGGVVADLALGVGKRLITALVKRVAGKSLAAIESAEVALARLRKTVAAEAAAASAKSSVNRTAAYISKSGITRLHYRAFQEAVTEDGVIAVVRNGKESALPLIERGCPGKPKIFEPFNTNEQTGILTAVTAADKELVFKSGYILIDESGVAMRRLANGTLEKVEVQNPFWKLEPGQVLDPALKKPVVGDYDLMGVIKPSNPGQVIALAAKDGVAVANRTNPIVDKFANTVNRKMDMPRVLHGPQDLYKGFRKGATAFFPDGTVLYMETQAEVETFYASMGRTTMEGSYPKPGPGTAVKDELAPRRGR